MSQLQIRLHDLIIICVVVFAIIMTISIVFFIRRLRKRQQRKKKSKDENGIELRSLEAGTGTRASSSSSWGAAIPSSGLPSSGPPSVIVIEEQDIADCGFHGPRHNPSSSGQNFAEHPCVSTDPPLSPIADNDRNPGNTPPPPQQQHRFSYTRSYHIDAGIVLPDAAPSKYDDENANDGVTHPPHTSFANRMRRRSNIDVLTYDESSTDSNSGLAHLTTTGTTTTAFQQSLSSGLYGLHPGASRSRDSLTLYPRSPRGAPYTYTDRARGSGVERGSLAAAAALPPPPPPRKSRFIEHLDEK